jgi:2-polyprenyl-3-methyl-5-hydroxy-6-metoxy-1,4-benzoquinol methylase
MENPIKIQEDQYVIPYHWSGMQPDSYRGRVYWGYLNMILEIAGNIAGKNVLDAGCGDGRFSAELKKRGADVTGVDLSEKALSFAKIFLPDVNFLQAGIESLPLSDKIFDFIFFIETLEHIPPENIPAVLSELKRVLKDDGMILISTPSTLIPKSPKHYQHFTVESLNDIFLQNGFAIEEIFGNDKKSLIFDNIYRLADNRFYEIKPLRKWLNLKIYPKFLMRSANGQAKRFIVKLGKKVCPVVKI